MHAAAQGTDCPQRDRRRALGQGPLELLADQRADTAAGRPPLANLLAFSPDGRRLAFTLYTHPGPGLVVYEIARRAIVASLPEVSASSVAFSPDGRRLALGEAVPGAIVLLDARTLALQRRFSPIKATAAVPTALAFSHDGSELAYGFADGTAGLAAAATGRSLAIYYGYTSPVWQTSFSADGQLVATSSLDGRAAAWRASGLALHSVQMRGLYEPNQPGSVVLTGAARGDGFVVKRLLDDGRAAARPLVLSPTPDLPVLSPGGRFAVLIPQTGQGTMRLWDVTHRRLVRSVRIHGGADNSRPGITPDGNLIARDVIVSPSRFDLRVFDTRTGRSRVFASTACVDGWHGITFSRSGRLLFAGTRCRPVSVWNVATGRGDDGRLALGGQVASAAFSPDERHIAVASWDGAITVSPFPITGQGITLAQNTKAVLGVAYSPDGRYLASAGLDRTVRIFDAHTLAQLHVIPQPAAVYQVAFTPDSKDVLSSSPDGMWLWDACTACENPTALVALARSRVTRSLTAEERSTFEPQ